MTFTMPKFEGRMTYGEILQPAMAVETQEQADEFMKLYVAWGMKQHGWSESHARDLAMQNIGYYTGYCDNETAKRVLNLFNTSHPIFGKEQPTPEKAFEMGKEMAIKDSGR